MNIFIYIPSGGFEHEIWELARVFFPGYTVKVLDKEPGKADKGLEEVNMIPEELGKGLEEVDKEPGEVDREPEKVDKGTEKEYKAHEEVDKEFGKVGKWLRKEFWEGHNRDDYLLTAEYSYLDSEVIAGSRLEAKHGKLLAHSTQRQKLGENIRGSYLKEKREIKKLLCQCVYDVLSEFTGKRPHWGILTGVRPLKVVHNLMDDGLGEGEVLDILASEYRVRCDKAGLLVETAKNQRDVIKSTSADMVSLYVHIPFCTTKCLYCSFPSVVMGGCGEIVDAYIDCLIIELNQIVALLIDRGTTIQSLYIGGGTPTALAYPQMERLLSAVALLLDGRAVAEYTVECGRPDSLDMDKLWLLKAFGVNRISINPQTMNQETLAEIGRRHTVEQIISRFHMARYVGFDCINMDVIVGLPGEGVPHMERTMAAIASLQPDNVTVHTLAIKRASRLKESLDRYPLTRDDTAEDMLEVCHRWIRDMGLVPYYLYRQKYMVGNLENVGYTKPGKACIYNIQMMGEKQTIWAFGAGAVSKVYFAEEDCIHRVPNVKDVKEYIERLEEMIQRKRRFMERNTAGGRG